MIIVGNQMKVSILIPVYGVERFIAECAQSLMEQTYHDIEFIFVNDCTRDHSIEVLREVIDQYPERKSQVTIIEHEENKGLAGARITGLNASSGDAVLIVDSDDYVSPKAVELLVNAMQSTNVDVVDGGYAIVTNGKTLVYKPLHVSHERYLKTILCQNVEPNRIWGRLIKKSLFVEHDICFTQGVDYGEDFSVLPRLLAFASRAWVDECLYYYRDDNPNSYTNNISTKNAVSFLKSQQIVGEFFAGNEQWRRYRTATEIGWVNVWRFARRYSIDTQIVDENFSLVPSYAITRFLTTIMKSLLPYGIVNGLYLAARRLYLMFA